MKLTQGVAILVTLGLLAGCTEPELILEGERLGVREALSVPEEGAAAPLDATAPAPDMALSLPAPLANADWTQKRGNARHKITHPALGSVPTLVWSANIGTGDSRRYQITAEPVVAGDRIFTLDSQSRVMAHGLDGAALWSADLTPPSERTRDATGGGLAYEDGRVFATTGFGTLVALDAATGAVLWVQRTDAAVTGAPAVADGLVYVVGRDNRAWAVRAEDGRVQWQLPGTPSPSGLLGGAAPAVTEQLAIFPFGSSELVAALRKSGVRVWGALISGQRRGRVYAQVKDITGDPVIADGVLYAGNQSGRLAAIRVANGERLWTAEEGSYSPVWPVAGAVFLISDQNELIRLDAETGARVWGVQLPYFTKQRVKRRDAIFAHYGPVLAGGRLIVASDDGLLRFFDPATGAEAGALTLPGGAASGPVVAGRTLYVVSARGQLHAFR
ncbi:PQQ-binding-like beta-propeller repeat protein [Actibacterium sp. MT2.3-13A]|uniref:outer membrane protein assembly factor BamB family protein n=1 Tax=Actibacterium sp. MT2.3-13A TaxID=2828332 RepID=UPI0032C2376C